MPRPRKFNEQRALEAARDTFWKSGYSGTSISDLTEAIGIGPQSLYNTFGSKRDLFLRILDEYCQTRMQLLEASLDSEESAWESTMRVVAFTDSARTPLPPEGCLLVKSTTELGCHDEDVLAQSARAYRGHVALLQRRIEQAQHNGEIPAELSPRELALALETVMQGIEYLAKTGIGAEEISEARRASVALVMRSVGMAPD